MQVTYFRRRTQEVVIAYIWRQNNGRYRGYSVVRSGIEAIPPEWGHSQDRMTEFLRREGYSGSDGRASVTQRASLDVLNQMYENQAWMLA